MAEVQGGGLKAVLPSVSSQEPCASVLQEPRLPEPPLVVRQHLESPRKYIVLTQQGADILLKLRPVDLLRQLLVENRGPEADAVKLFFETQKEDQACATSLILACLQSVQNQQVAEWATRAFFMYGGEPKIRTAPSLQYSMAPGGECMDHTVVPLNISIKLITHHNTQCSTYKYNNRNSYNF